MKLLSKYFLKTLFCTIVLFLLVYSCKKDKKETNEEPAVTGTISDIDGNTYPTVKIGDQWWMAENLKTTKLNDGTVIPIINDTILWSNMNTAAYCWYENDYETYGKVYGGLYNWYAIGTGKLSPAGWHVASEADWNKLIDYLGGESIAGGKLKETSYAHWLDPNTGATNETGFRGLPGGYRAYDGKFMGNTYGGFWWIADELNQYTGKYRYMYYRDIYILKDQNYKRTGYSIRCVKD